MDKKYIRRSEKGGFTFIELIIAVTIFSVIAVSVYSVFSVGIKLWSRTGPLIQENQSIRLFFNTISSDLKSAVYYYPKKGINFEGSAQEISFMALVKIPGQSPASGMELAKITYSFDPAKNTVKRVVATKAQGFNKDYATPDDILNNVESKDFNFAYCYKVAYSPTYYGYEWRNVWEDEDRDSGKIPCGVRVNARSYSKIIFIPTGTLGGKDVQQK